MPEPVATLGHIRGRGPLDTSSCETGTQEIVGGMKQPEVAEGSGTLPAGAIGAAGYRSVPLQGGGVAAPFVDEFRHVGGEGGIEEDALARAGVGEAEGLGVEGLAGAGVEAVGDELPVFRVARR